VALRLLQTAGPPPQFRRHSETRRVDDPGRPGPPWPSRGLEHLPPSGTRAGECLQKNQKTDENSHCMGNLLNITLDLKFSHLSIINPGLDVCGAADFSSFLVRNLAKRDLMSLSLVFSCSYAGRGYLAFVSCPIIGQ